MFSFCYGLTSLDLRSFDIINVGDTDYMIVCGNLKELYISPTMEDIHNNACAFMGNIKVHITIYAPEGFDFGTDTTGDYFVWKRGYFTLGTTVSLNISTAGIRTYSNYYSLDYSNIDNLKAYIISDHDPSTGELILTNVNEVPAGEGVLLIGEEGSYDVPIKPTDAKYTNLLIGCPFAKTISPTEPDYVNYILANGIHGINFYTLSGSGEIGANKAYLHLQKKGTSEAKSFLFFEIPYDEEDNGISIASSVRNVADKERGHIKDSIIYDLQGRRVSQLGKGIYIRDGKTIVIQ
jgi:surface protein